MTSTKTRPKTSMQRITVTATAASRCAKGSTDQSTLVADINNIGQPDHVVMHVHTTSRKPSPSSHGYSSSNAPPARGRFEGRCNCCANLGQTILLVSQGLHGQKWAAFATVVCTRIRVGWINVVDLANKEMKEKFSTVIKRTIPVQQSRLTCSR
ncbi:hypothetical protein BCR44DRAFT_46701, partial [Catenaria anguillulae PL171]